MNPLLTTDNAYKRKLTELYSFISVADYSQDFVCQKKTKKLVSLIPYRRRIILFKNYATIVDDYFKLVLDDAVQQDVLLPRIKRALYLWNRHIRLRHLQMMVQE